MDIIRRLAQLSDLNSDNFGFIHATSAPKLRVVDFRTSGRQGDFDSFRMGDDNLDYLAFGRMLERPEAERLAEAASVMRQDLVDIEAKLDHAGALFESFLHDDSWKAYKRRLLANFAGFCSKLRAFGYLMDV